MVKKIILAFVCVMMLFWSSSVQARQVIRDTEIEETLRLYGDPIFEAANIPTKSVELILIGSPVLNAFVAGGMNIFIYTGLILETSDPSEMMAVLAHETGHIAGGHLLRMSEKLEEAQLESLIATVLGGLVGAGAGSSSGGAAVSSAAQNVIQKSLLKHSRVHESAADQAGFSYLKSLNIPLSGNVRFLKKLKKQEGSGGQHNEYVRTHPLTLDRIRSAEEQLKQTPDSDMRDLSEWQDRHDRMKAKILAFTYPEQALLLHSGMDIVDLYAKAIAYYRLGQIDDRFLPVMDGLLKAEPKNPYFWELKGQALFEYGRIEDAMVALKKAIELRPDSPLIETLYAHALIEKGDKASLERAVSYLQNSLRQEKPSSFRYHLLGRAYAGQGDHNRASLYLAEEALLKGDEKRALQLVQSLENAFEYGSPEWVRVQDIHHFGQKKADQKVKNK